ncbi:hypothetical protein NX722_28345 [Endozoicomonas gorgoniicola]|uniref:Uncharacterized protein n=1 Tax=Endozoicomonas gorgoniicola TaxID=1234144 RepID=A0ABT3N4B6_9GAMM|nr:hypothetical protein [Endozoicomonas gorgoniicola]MCW7551071.1 hypothetical protein [Endozoicomonas gorgoniicola]MCW7556477.1 hypothetical protein [Endozoicomonas gorgoniicola]
MTPEHQHALLRHWLQDEPHAIDLAYQFVAISQIWDDLIDRDKPVDNDAINRMMRYALVEIPKNPFYQTHIQSLHPVLEDRLYTWLDANALEAKGNCRDLQVSYIIRSVITDLIIHLAFLVGGFDWRQQAALALRQAVYRDNESFFDYWKEQRHVYEQ